MGVGLLGGCWRSILILTFDSRDSSSILFIPVYRYTVINYARILDLPYLRARYTGIPGKASLYCFFDRTYVHINCQFFLNIDLSLVQGAKDVDTVF